MLDRLFGRGKQDLPAEPTCAACGRTLLPGEWAQTIVRDDGVEEVVCSLCAQAHDYDSSPNGQDAAVADFDEAVGYGSAPPPPAEVAAAPIPGTGRPQQSRGRTPHEDSDAFWRALKEKDAEIARLQAEVLRLQVENQQLSDQLAGRAGSGAPAAWGAPEPAEAAQWPAEQAAVETTQWGAGPPPGHADASQWVPEQAPVDASQWPQEPIAADTGWAQEQPQGTEWPQEAPQGGEWAQEQPQTAEYAPEQPATNEAAAWPEPSSAPEAAAWATAPAPAAPPQQVGEPAAWPEPLPAVEPAEWPVEPAVTAAPEAAAQPHEDRQAEDDTAAWSAAQMVTAAAAVTDEWTGRSQMPIEDAGAWPVAPLEAASMGSSVPPAQYAPPQGYAGPVPPAEATGQPAIGDMPTEPLEMQEAPAGDYAPAYDAAEPHSGTPAAALDEEDATVMIPAAAVPQQIVFEPQPEPADLYLLERGADLFNVSPMPHKIAESNELLGLPAVHLSSDEDTVTALFVWSMAWYEYKIARGTGDGGLADRGYEERAMERPNANAKSDGTIQLAPLPARRAVVQPAPLAAESVPAPAATVDAPIVGEPQPVMPGKGDIISKSLKGHRTDDQGVAWDEMAARDFDWGR